MINIKKKEQCCGCNACVQICPHRCIALSEDYEGFLYPEVDMKKCVDCGLCEKICPIVNASKKTDKVIAAYVAYTKNEELRVKSSSGGVFSSLSEQILKDNGLIFGAAFDESNLVHHIGIDNLAQLELLRGSKYLQSRVESTYINAKKVLETGKKVLYTGTPCQIAGLKMFLQKEYDNLYTVDILCHGAPTPKLWKKYIEEKEREFEASVNKISFRDKTFGWKTFALKLQFNNKKEYIQVLRKDLFMRLFLSNICLRPSCHKCRFKSLERDADITIGDAWGISNIMPDMDDDQGTSVIFIHTEKGAELFEGIKSEIIYKAGEADVLLPKHSDSRKSVKSHSKRKQFFKLLNCNSKMQELTDLTKPSLLTRAKYRLSALKENIHE